MSDEKCQLLRFILADDEVNCARMWFEKKYFALKNGRRFQTLRKFLLFKVGSFFEKSMEIRIVFGLFNIFCLEKWMEIESFDVKFESFSGKLLQNSDENLIRLWSFQKFFAWKADGKLEVWPLLHCFYIWFSIKTVTKFWILMKKRFKKSCNICNFN